MQDHDLYISAELIVKTLVNRINGETSYIN